MIVWCVFRDYDYEGEALLRICTTEAAAEEYVEQELQSRGASGFRSDYIINEWAVHGPPQDTDTKEGK